MLTINPEIVKIQRQSNECFTVRLRFTLNRKMKRISTSLFATSKDLTKDFKIKPSSPLKREVNNLIRSYQSKCAKLQIELNRYTIDEIMDYLNDEQQKRQTIDFIKFSREWIATTTIKGAPNYTTAINALVRFVGEESLNINLITLDFLEQFKAFLIKEREERTKKKRYNKKEKNLILIPNSPFVDFEIPKQEATRKRAIPADIIKKVWELPYRDMKRGYKSTNRFNLAKDCFILSFCLMGINSADLYNATEMKGNTIIYYRTKTKARRLDNAKMMVDIPKIIHPIIDKYRDKTGRRL